MDRKAKATKKRQKLNLKEANGYKAEADNFAPQEQPIGKVNTEKASKLNHFAPAACSPPPCLSSISTPVWQLTHWVQQKEAPTSPTTLPSMLYFSLASDLRSNVGMQGMIQPRRQQRIPGFSRPSAFW